MLFITRGHFACACVHTVNDNSVGASNVVAGNRELAWSYSPFQSNFVGALNTLLSYKKCSPWQKIGRFLRGFSVVDFSTAGVLDFLKTLKRLNANNHCSFHCQSNAFRWFDFQTHGFTYQGRNASWQCSCLCGTSTDHIDVCAYKMPPCCSLFIWTFCCCWHLHSS